MQYDLLLRAYLNTRAFKYILFPRVHSYRHIHVYTHTHTHCHTQAFTLMLVCACIRALDFIANKCMYFKLNTP